MSSRSIEVAQHEWPGYASFNYHFIIIFYIPSSLSCNFLYPFIFSLSSHCFLPFLILPPPPIYLEDISPLPIDHLFFSIFPPSFSYFSQIYMQRHLTPLPTMIAFFLQIRLMKVICLIIYLLVSHSLSILHRLPFVIFRKNAAPGFLSEFSTNTSRI